MNDLAKLAIACVCLAIAIAHACCDAKETPPPVVNPKTYRAPSGRYTLTVDPSAIYGTGRGTYRLRFAGRERWSAMLPFTLCEAGVTDEGVAFGYAYTHTPAGHCADASGVGPGDFLVVILDPNGGIRLQESVKRQWLRRGWPEPCATALLFDPANDRAIIRLYHPDANRPDELWWIYRLSTATLEAKVAPGDLMDNSKPPRPIRDARPIRATPLMLLQWSRSDGGDPKSLRGPGFTLVDRDLRPVWSLELSKDYATPTDREKLRNLECIQQGGAILRTEEPGRFDLFLAAESKRATFSVRPGAAGGWLVTETARASSGFPQPKNEVPDAIPTRPLKSLGTISLPIEDPLKSWPFAWVYDFAFDAQGRVGFFRWTWEKPWAFVLVDQATGKILRETELTIASAHNSEWDACCCVGGSRFVITNFGLESGGKSHGWWIDGQSGRLQPIPNFDCPKVKRLIGFRDGSFVALTDENNAQLIAFDPPGRRTWTREPNAKSSEPPALARAEDLAATADGKLAVVDSARKRIVCFDRAGHYRSQIGFPTAGLAYAEKIAAGLDGNFLVGSNDCAFVQMRRDGTVRPGFVPKHPSGWFVDARNGLRRAPDGRLWASDGWSIVRLTEGGIVDHVLGRPPDPRRLGFVTKVVMDDGGRLYAADCQTGAIHVFDAQGRFHHVCETKPSDFRGDVSAPPLAVRDSGDVYLGLGGLDLADNRRFAHFSPNGVRLAGELLPTCDYNHECPFQPRTGNMVWIQDSVLRLVAPSGGVCATIHRRPDRNWLAWIRRVVFAPDGSMAVLADTPSPRRETPSAVCLYKPSGDPIGTIVLPGNLTDCPRIAYSGHRVVVADETGLIIYDGAGVPLLRSPYPLRDQQKYRGDPYLSADGRELRFVGTLNPVVQRYELP